MDTSILWSLTNVEVFSWTVAPCGNSFDVFAGIKMKSITAARGAFSLPVKVVRAAQVAVFIMFAGRRSRELVKARRWSPHMFVQGMSVL